MAQKTQGLNGILFITDKFMINDDDRDYNTLNEKPFGFAWTVNLTVTAE